MDRRDAGEMLVLGCTSHQSVIIDDVIKVTVLYNKRGQVVLDVSTQEKTAQLNFFHRASHLASSN